MLRPLFISLSFLLSTAFASENDSTFENSLVVIEGEPSANVAGCVNAITGDFFFSQDDIYVEGAQPLILRRSYISGTGLGQKDYEGKVHQTGWSFVPHMYIHLYENSEFLRIPEPSGAVLSYEITPHKCERIRRGKHVRLKPAENLGLTNSGHNQGLPSALHNLKNNSVEVEDKILTVYASDGSIRSYERADHRGAPKPWDIGQGDNPKKRRSLYTLKRERFPNGNYQTYHYDKHQRVERICTQNDAMSKTYAYADITYDGYKKSHDFTIKTSDGRSYEYIWGKNTHRTFYLRKVRSSVNPDEKLRYIDIKDHGELLHERILPDGRVFRVDYYDKHSKTPNRVKAIYNPGNSQATHTFHYFPGKEGKTGGYTEVFDALGNKTIYRYSAQMRLEEIEYPERQKVRFTWDGEGNLLCKLVINAKDEVMLTQRFCYDSRGNVCEETLADYHKRYTYNDRNLLVKAEEDNGRAALFTYLADTNLVTSELTIDHGQIKIRRFWEYDQNHFLIRELCDDGSTDSKDNLTGITQRQIKQIHRRTQPLPVQVPHFTKRAYKSKAEYAQAKRDYYANLPPAPTPIKHEDMPDSIEEKYLEAGCEKLLQKVQFTYSDLRQVIRQDFFDAEGKHRYSLHTTYDEKGRIQSETNPLGQTTRYTYDANNNKTLIEDLSTGRTTSLTYDCANRLIRSNENGHVTQYKYDPAGRKSSMVDYLGKETTYTYNALGQLLETHLPAVLNEEGIEIHPRIIREVDILGRETALINPKGERVETTYNIRGKPTRIHYPDDTQVTFTYNLDGTPYTTTDQEGVTTLTQSDFLGRPLTKQIFSPTGELLLQETKNYNAFHLLSTQDAMGNTTTYFYNGAGRKIAEETNGTERVEFSYDPLGHLYATKSGDKISITACDLLGRLIEERTEDEKGSLLSRQLYSYDALGNKSLITRFVGDTESKEHFQYDLFKRPIKQIDALGHITTISYDEQDTHKKVHTDPLGTQTIETFDPLSRLICKEQRSHLGQILSKENLFYDQASNLSRQESFVFSKGEFLHKTITRWEYGPMGRLTKLTEATGTPEQKITQYSYTARGERKTTIKPDQTQLLHTYDPLGRLILLESSDQTIRYAYTYNKLHQVTKSQNLNTSKTTERTYDHKGRVLLEKLESGLTFQNHYDEMGRRTHFILPDHSSIEYHYDPLFLREVHRKTKEGALLYKHTFNTYDLSGHLLEETLIGKAGHSHHSIDPLGRCHITESPHFKQEIKEYDPCGNIKKINWTIAGLNRTTTYQYDPLSQLTQETGLFPTTLTNDSHYNRLSKNETPYTLNKLNQLVSRYTYDLNGNPLTKGAERYTYDALDRLVEILCPNHTKILFTYDSDHRRQTRQLFTWDQNKWKETERHTYLYDGQNEIGAIDATNQIVQLRVLGQDTEAEIGSAIALELYGNIYAPIHDQQGNIAALLSAKTGDLEEFYHYSAFGEELIFNSSGQHLPTSRNPWHFCSKRLEGNLIFFGRRYFDPEIGRWLTPDPSGFTDGLNLYAFVLNNPLTHLDLFGLETIDAPRNGFFQVHYDKSVHLIRTGFEYIGTFVNKLFYHFAPPIPWIRNFGMAIGNILAGRVVSTDFHSAVLGPIGNPGVKSSADIYLLTGQLTTTSEGFDQGVKASQACGGMPITVVYNSTKGALLDTGESILGKLGVSCHSEKMGLKMVRESIQNQREVVLLAWSQGGIVGDNILTQLSPEERKMVTVRTLGSASLFKGGGAKDVQHFVDRRDIVPKTDFLRYFKALFFSSNVTFIKGKTRIPGWAHDFMSPTYQGALNDIGQDIQRDFKVN